MARSTNTTEEGAIPVTGRKTLRTLSGLGLATAILIASGCATGGGQSVSELHLFGVPVALNLDPTPGPDGIGVRVYASDAGGTEGIVIRQGTLEVLLYDGIVSSTSARTTPPLKIWSFSPAALKAYSGKTSLGSGYQFALKWAPEIPRQPAVTVIARYRAPGGAVLWSTANTVSVTAK